MLKTWVSIIDDIMPYNYHKYRNIFISCSTMTPKVHTLLQWRSTIWHIRMDSIYTSISCTDINDMFTSHSHIKWEIQNATNFSFQYWPYNMHKHWDIFIWCFMMIQSSHTLLQWNYLMTTLGWIQFMRPFHARYQWHIFVLHHILKINAYELFSTCISI